MRPSLPASPSAGPPSCACAGADARDLPRRQWGVPRPGVERPAGAADATLVAPSDLDALRLLFAAGHAALEPEGGAPLPVELRGIEDGAVLASAPRLRVAQGRTLLGRIVGEDGSPYVVTLRIASAAYETADLAALRLEAVSVADDPTRRQSTRVPVGGLAQLEAVSCQNVVDGDRVEGTLVDLSRSGVAFATTRVLTRGDRLRFHGRFFADTISAEVRVA